MSCGSRELCSKAAASALKTAVGRAYDSDCITRSQPEKAKAEERQLGKATSTHLVVTVGPASCLLLHSDVDTVFLFPGGRTSDMFVVIIKGVVTSTFTFGSSSNRMTMTTTVYPRVPRQLVGPRKTFFAAGE